MNDQNNRATIGTSIRIKGDVTGSEDLLIQGSIEGTVSLEKHLVTVGENAVVQANISAREVRVLGEVHGDLYGQERVTVCTTGRVKGNITSPCLSLEEGARLKGAIDTDGASGNRVAVTVEETSSQNQLSSRISQPSSDSEASVERAN